MYYKRNFVEDFRWVDKNFGLKSSINLKGFSSERNILKWVDWKDSLEGWLLNILESKTLKKVIQNFTSHLNYFV